MSAGLHPADSLNHLNRDSGIPFDSIRSATALAVEIPASGSHKAKVLFHRRKIAIVVQQ
jgi:hypothetical protein